MKTGLIWELSLSSFRFQVNEIPWRVGVTFIQPSHMQHKRFAIAYLWQKSAAWKKIPPRKEFAQTFPFPEAWIWRGSSVIDENSFQAL